MKKSILFLSVLILTLMSCGKNHTAQNNESYDSLSMLMMQIKKCSRLYTAEYKVRKIVTHKDQMQLKGSLLHQSFDIHIPAGTRRIAIPMTATLKAYIDFNDFSKRNIKKHSGQLEIILPDPKIEITSTKIDHKGIRSSVPLLRSGFNEDELSAYEQQGRNAILEDIPHMGIIETARQNAAKILIPLAEAMGYSQENIKITFRKDFTAGDIQQLLNTNRIEHEKE